MLQYSGSMGFLKSLQQPLIFAGMYNRKWWSILLAVIIIASCFFPWVVIEYKNIVISGVNAEGTNFGKPGYLSILLSGLVLLFSFFAKAWAQRINLIAGAFNVAWALRNFMILSACAGGECPQRQPAFYIYFICCILLLVSVVMQKIKVTSHPLPHED